MSTFATRSQKPASGLLELELQERVSRNESEEPKQRFSARAVCTLSR